MNLRALAIGSMTCMAMAAVGSAQGDVKGSRDHPLFTRYAGALIVGYETKGFDEFTLPLGPTRFAKDFATVELTKSQRVEGTLTRILYVAPEGRSTLEVMRNYEQAMKTAGFQSLFTCTDVGCDADRNVAKFENHMYPLENRLMNSEASKQAFASPKALRYLAARASANGRAVFASLMIATEGYEHSPENIKDRVLTLLEIVEERPMDAGLVTTTADALSRAIADTGHASVYGILFDTNSATVKAESDAALKEVGALLTRDPKLSLFVVGHTDGVGDPDANLQLSQRRADAVVKVLAARFGVDARRLRSHGVGQFAPVAANATEDGRARNRRVDLVRQ